MNTKLKGLMSDTVIFALGNMLSKLVLFLLMPFYTSMLSVSEYGIADTINNFVELLIPIATLCISEAVFRFLINDKDDSSIIIKDGIGIIVVGSSLVTIIVLIINYFANFSWILYLLMLLWTQIIRQFTGYVLRGLGKSKEFAFTGVLATIFLVIFNLILLKHFDLKIEGYLLSIVFSNVFTIIVSIFIILQIGLLDNRTETSYKRKMLNYSLPIIPNNISWWINTASSRYILLFFLGNVSTGMYAAASKLPAIINMLSAIFQQAWMYSASKIYKENSDSKSEFYSLVFKYYSMFLNISCSIIIFIIPFISKFILRDDFYDAWKYVPLLLISACLGAYSVFFGGLYAASMNNKIVMRSTILGALINIAVSLLLVPTVGIHGVTIASFLCYLTIVIYRFLDTKKIISLQINQKKVLVSIFANCKIKLEK